MMIILFLLSLFQFLYFLLEAFGDIFLAYDGAERETGSCIV